VLHAVTPKTTLPYSLIANQFGFIYFIWYMYQDFLSSTPALALHPYTNL